MGAYLQKHWYKILMITISVILLALIVYRFIPKTEKLPDLGKAPEFTLTSMNGEKVSLEESSGKARVVYFFFSTCPDVCSPTTYKLSRVQDRLKEENKFGSEVVFHSITFDPVKDTPEQLKKFATTFHADPAGWNFLRGEEEEIKAIASGYGVSILKDKDGNFAHTNYLTIVDGKGNMRKTFNATTATEEEIYNNIMKVVN
ncbi:SCO family protein [Paenibacillus turpanensis]|uniref:SCO family protein n=1 Tax=Paenibacillus turpanensis TaxID=2689078 RepID=UPI00140DE023|nr:SCO family protein [Paenibacillus turpanensis]